MKWPYGKANGFVFRVFFSLNLLQESRKLFNYSVPMEQSFSETKKRHRYRDGTSTESATQDSSTQRKACALRTKLRHLHDTVVNDVLFVSLGWYCLQKIRRNKMKMVTMRQVSNITCMSLLSPGCRHMVFTLVSFK